MGLRSESLTAITLPALTLAHWPAEDAEDAALPAWLLEAWEVADDDELDCAAEVAVDALPESPDPPPPQPARSNTVRVKTPS